MSRAKQAAEASEAGQRGGARFATTHWTMVVNAANDATEDGISALEELCRTYWPPLYAFARRQGMAAADAEDIVQGFFEDFLARRSVAAADSSQGRFRTYLISSFRHFQANRHRFRTSKKRGGGETILSLEAIREYESRIGEEPATSESPEKIYDRRWTGQLLSQACAYVRREYEAMDKAALFDEMRNTLWSGRGSVRYSELAEQHGMSEGAFKIAVHRLKRRVGEQFRREVAKTVIDSEDIEEEIRYLRRVVVR